MTDNELIAEFMGLVRHNKQPHLIWVDDHGWNCFVSQDKLLYNKSWDWLMPVVEKIEGTRVEIQPYNLAFEFDCDITGSHVIIDSIVRPNGQKKVRFVKIGKTKIEATYQAVVDFIKWYNTTKNLTLSKALQPSPQPPQPLKP